MSYNDDIGGSRDGEQAAAPGCDLGWSIGMLMRHHKARAQPCIVDLPRGFRGYQVLYTVLCKDLPNQLQMAQYLAVRRRGRVVVRQPDPDDRRARNVVATPLGRETFRRLQGHVAEAEGAVLAAPQPTEAEQEQFRSLQSRVARQARDEAERGGAAASGEEV